MLFLLPLSYSGSGLVLRQEKREQVISSLPNNPITNYCHDGWMDGWMSRQTDKGKGEGKREIHFFFFNKRITQNKNHADLYHRIQKKTLGNPKTCFNLRVRVQDGD